MLLELYKALNNVIKMIDFIITNSLNTRLFEQLCEEMDAEQKCLPLPTEVRWRSRGKSLNRVFELRKPLQRFFWRKNHTWQNILVMKNGFSSLFACLPVRQV